MTFQLSGTLISKPPIIAVTSRRASAPAGSVDSRKSSLPPPMNAVTSPPAKLDGEHPPIDAAEHRDRRDAIGSLARGRLAPVQGLPDDVAADDDEQQRPEAKDVRDQVQPLAEHHAADQDPDGAADHSGGRSRLHDLRDADDDEDRRPEAQEIAGPQDLEVVEREQDAEGGEHQAGNELAGQAGTGRS